MATHSWLLCVKASVHGATIIRRRALAVCRLDIVVEVRVGVGNAVRVVAVPRRRGIRQVLGAAVGRSGAEMRGTATLAVLEHALVRLDGYVRGEAVLDVLVRRPQLVLAMGKHAAALIRAAARGYVPAAQLRLVALGENCLRSVENCLLGSGRVGGVGSVHIWSKSRFGRLAVKLRSWGYREKVEGHRM